MAVGFRVRAVRGLGFGGLGLRVLEVLCSALVVRLGQAWCSKHKQAWHASTAIGSTQSSRAFVILAA